MLKTLGVPHCDDDRWPSFDVVAYHDHCTDGIAAAAVVSLAVEGAGGSQPEFVPVQYGQALPQRILDGGKRLLFVDFCPEREQIPLIQAAWQDWLAIDHHKHRDWLPAPRTLERWREMVYLDDVTRWLSDGACLLKSRTRAAQGLAKKAFLTKTLYGLPFRAVNATENISEVGEEILREFPDVDVACAFFQVGAGTIQLSFRSRAHQPGLQTALDAARELGGGGHEHAAGARMSLDEWPDFLWREG